MRTLCVWFGLLFLSACLSIAQEREQEAQPSANSTVAKARLRRNAEILTKVVNQSASVENDCTKDGKDARVVEKSKITELEGCRLVVKMRKTTIFATGEREVTFTTEANLEDLTTPVAVESQTFAGCHAKEGQILKVSSNAAPGKKLKVTRTAKGGNSEDAKESSEIARRDVTFFFHDAVAAPKAARALEHLVKLCGGNEWPDEDDLP